MRGKPHTIGALAALAALLLVAAAGAQTIDPKREGYDVMRQITTQFLAPNMMIVLDSSGSLSFPVIFDDTSDDWLTDTSSNPDMAHSWLHVKTTSAVAGSTWDACLHIGADYTVSYSGGIGGVNRTCRYRDRWGNWQNLDSYPHSGAGQGYWVRMVDHSDGFTPNSGATTYTGSVSGAPTQQLKINCSSGNPVFAVGDVIQISSYDDANNGVYKVATVSSCSGSPKKSTFTFYRRTSPSTRSRPRSPPVAPTPPARGTTPSRRRTADRLTVRSSTGAPRPGSTGTPRRPPPSPSATRPSPIESPARTSSTTTRTT